MKKSLKISLSCLSVALAATALGGVFTLEKSVKGVAADGFAFEMVKGGSVSLKFEEGAQTLPRKKY